MKKLIAMALCLVLTLSLVGCVKNDTKTFEIAGAEKLTVMSGETGESIEITNANDIKYITDNIDGGLVYYRCSSQQYGCKLLGV